VVIPRFERPQKKYRHRFRSAFYSCSRWRVQRARAGDAAHQIVSAACGAAAGVDAADVAQPIQGGVGQAGEEGHAALHRVLRSWGAHAAHALASLIAMKKLRIERFGFGTGRQKLVLERCTKPKRMRRTCRPRYGLPSCRGKSAGVAKRPRELISHPKSPQSDSQLLHRCEPGRPWALPQRSSLQPRKLFPTSAPRILAVRNSGAQMSFKLVQMFSFRLTGQPGACRSWTL
jgi:hypothetical protein